uniref:Uncharacterized protein n=2 Tax=Amphimedon queenslandica TaxID=400682 RepID=A0A1X7VKG8_AMPQE
MAAQLFSLPYVRRGIRLIHLSNPVFNSARREDVSKLSVAVNDRINGYRVTRVTDVPDFNLKAIELLHESTKAQHLHLARQDSNNVFGTTPMDSTGICHILEHTTLCGSAHYPVRDPFFKMLTRSLATFMNAFTANDWTFYPFSIQNYNDYRNLLSVYCDCMFHPNLKNMDFHHSELIGFRDMGDINEHLLQLERQIDTNEQNRNNQVLASSVLVLMIKRLFTKLVFPYASFPTTSLTGDQMVPILYEAIVLRIEKCGFKVACITLDGNSANRKFFKLIGRHSSEVMYYTKNPCSLTCNVYFISDPPHLIKTIRNCLASNKRNMEFNGMPISWRFVKDLYQMTLKSEGLTSLPKLTYEHINLTGFSKMRVDLAAQVLSSTVSIGMKTFLPDEKQHKEEFTER